MYRVLLFLGACFGLAAVCWAGSLVQFRAYPVRVLDGDTIVVTPDNPLTSATETIRLADIDCPEKDQPYGAEARALTEHFLKDAFLLVVAHGRERYCRVLADVYVGDVSLAELLVKSGLAWVYSKSKNAGLKSLEAEARTTILGLWQDPRSIPPWEWRKKKRR